MTTTEQQAAQTRAALELAAGGAVGVVVTSKAAQASTLNLPAATARAAAASAIIAALGAFLARRRARAREWLTVELSKRAVAKGQALGDDVIAGLIELEQQREEAFAQNSAIRMARDLPVALGIPDDALREQAVAGLLRREQTYARQRAEAMAVRAFAAVDRVVLKGQSPQGAFWRLDPGVAEHTAGCLLMGGKFWPWRVLDRVHPPRHGGCPCRLLGYGEAIAEGLMRAGDVQNVTAAVRSAAHIVMEGVLVPSEFDDVQGLLVEAYGSLEVVQVRQELIARGMTTAEQFDAQVFA